MYAIELTELTKKFKNRTAVDSLSFQINEGEIFSLLGQNGAEKPPQYGCFPASALPPPAMRKSWAAAFSAMRRT